MHLCDVTLREGDQMPGQSYSVEQKVTAGQTLDSLGLAFLQAGFPVTGEKDREAIRRLVADTDVDAAIIGLARAITGDVEAALDANTDIVEIIVPLSTVQLEHALGKSREEAFSMLQMAVDRAHEADTTAHITLVDAFRTDSSHLVEAFTRFPDVEMINLADTVGARTPRTVRSVLTELAESVDLGRAGVHFHDDLGVATANVFAADACGVGKADVSVASLGERAGNPALEEVVVAGGTDLDKTFGIEQNRLIPACSAVLDELGETVEPRKAVLGREVTEHESGIHTAAMLDEPATFEPFEPDTFGGDRRLLFGAGTGRGGARKLLNRAGVKSTPDRVEALLTTLKKRGPVDTHTAVGIAGEQDT